MSGGRRAADLLVHCLAAQGTDRMFCVPGESYLALLDALQNTDKVQLVTCRHEGGAGFMALTDAKITGRPGVVAVSRGPGATNVSIAVHMAEQDATPLVVLVGQVDRSDRGRGAFQEVDYAAFFGIMAKGIWEIEDAGKLPQNIASAYKLALDGTPGPVILSLPEDMLYDAVDAAPLPSAKPGLKAPSDEDIEAVSDLLAKAARPIVIAGGGIGDNEARHALVRAAEAHDLPVALAFKHQDVFDNSHPCFAGYLGFKIPKPQVEAMAEADLVLAVGTRLTDVTTQNYTFPAAPTPKQPLVHVYPDEKLLGSVYETTCAIAADPTMFLERLASSPEPTASGRTEWRNGLHERAVELARYVPRNAPDGVDFGAVVHTLSKHAQPDTVIVTDAGNFSSWVHRYWPWGRETQLYGAVGGAMGMGVPGAVAAAMRCPERQVLSFVGDGGALMTGNELATAVKYGVPVKVFISNNGSYATIRQHQEMGFPGRGAGTGLSRPDFAKWAESLGAKGLVIDTDSDIEAVVSDAIETKESVVVDVRSSLELISAYTTIGEIHARQRG